MVSVSVHNSIKGVFDEKIKQNRFESVHVCIARKFQTQIWATEILKPPSNWVTGSKRADIKDMWKVIMSKFWI